jgi:CheY-like chemotaxis protein
VREADVARALVPEHCWDALVADVALGPDALRQLAASATGVMRRIALLAPAERHQLEQLRQDGFSGWLVKPARVASLAARLTGDDVRAQVPPPARAPAPAKAAGLSVLLAEDNEINALLACTLLARLGHEVTVADSGEAAVAAFVAARQADAPFDLVLMDVQMPGLDGIAATGRIRSIEGMGQPTPIVALSANALEEDRAACLAAGMNATLVKPLDRDRLVALVAALRPAAPAAA